jgi:hypothetical protein
MPRRAPTEAALAKPPARAPSWGIDRAIPRVLHADMPPAADAVAVEDPGALTTRSGIPASGVGEARVSVRRDPECTVPAADLLNQGPGVAARAQSRIPLLWRSR